MAVVTRPGTDPLTADLSLKLSSSTNQYSYPRSPRSRSPVRLPPPSHVSRLCLRRVDGTTAGTVNAFDSLPSQKTFAYTAGAAAITVRLDDQSQLSQRFYRARPTAAPLNTTSTFSTPLTPTHSSVGHRNRPLTPLRDHGFSPRDGGASPSSDWGDSPSNRTWTSRERVKAVTCVSLSPDGRYLAVGETGYNPRVLIFSTASDGPSDVPISIITEHSYGVCAVAFSPDSRHLATLGCSQDGFLHVFSVNARTGAVKLALSNKCTSFVHALIWISDTTIMTAGIRHVKIWRIGEKTTTSPSKSRFLPDGNSPGVAASPNPKSLPGRNCLLGPLVESTFTCAAHLRDGQALVCTREGDICLVHDVDGTQRLSRLGQAGFSISSIAMDVERLRLWLGGVHGHIRELALGELLNPATPPASPSTRSISPPPSIQNNGATIVALAAMTDSLVTIDASNAVRVLDRRSRRASGASTLANSPGHSSAVLGVSALRTPADDRAAYMTWAADGSILSWTLKGEVLSQVKIVLEQPRSSGGDAPPNELKVLRISPDSTYFVTGDKLGILRIHDLRSGEVKRLQAHAAEITDIAIHQSDEMALIASAGRDRTIQLYRQSSDVWQLVQTLADHTGSVARLFFLKGGERLVSCCADRTVVVRDLASRQLETGPSFAYVPVRTIGLKATPVSMTFSSEDEETLIISTIDRNIHSIDVPSGRVNRTFRASDPDSKDAVVMDALASDSVDAASNGSKVIVGIATTDKSIRIYDESGSLIAKEWGHTEGISDLVILDAAPEQPGKTKTLISTGLDGTIFIWEYTPKPQILPEDSISADPTKELLGTQETPIFRTPLRKVLSRSELATFRKRSDLEMCSPEPSPPNTPSLPRVRKRTSKYTLASAKPETPPVPCPPAHLDLSASKVVPSPDRSPMERRSPPVYSPSRPVATPPETAPRSSLARSRTKSTGNLTELSMVTSTTEQICRALRSYRKKLATSPDTNLPTSSVKELERELALTTKALGERGARDREATAAAVTPTALNQILDQYSERLVQMVEKRIGGVTLAEDEEMNARKDTLEVGPKVEGVKDRDE